MVHIHMSLVNNPVTQLKSFVLGRRLTALHATPIMKGIVIMLSCDNVVLR